MVGDDLYPGRASGGGKQGPKLPRRSDEDSSLAHLWYITLYLSAA